MRLIALALLVSSAASVASAQAGDARDRALAMVDDARVLYDEGRFEEAATLLDEAYATYEEPAILFNAGRAYQEAGQIDEAIDRLERYLDSAGEVGNRAQTERRLQTLRAQRDRLAAAEAPDPSPPPVEDDGGGVSVDPLPWIVTGVGAAVVVVGAVLGALASDSYAEAELEPEHLRATELQQSAFDLATGANVTFVVGGALMAAGVIWGIVQLATSGDDDAQARRPGVLTF